LNKAREQAKLVQCMSNQRQLVLGVQMYSGANKQLIPFLYDYDEPPGFPVHYSNWIWTLTRDRYLTASPELFKCPSDNSEQVRNYRINWTLSSVLPPGVAGTPQEHAYMGPSGQKQNKIVRPSETILFVCLRMQWPDAHSLYDPTDVYWAEFVDALYPLGAKGDVMDRNHSPREDSVLCAFVDGHVSTVIYDRTRPETYFLPAGVKWRYTDWP